MSVSASENKSIDNSARRRREDRRNVSDSPRNLDRSTMRSADSNSRRRDDSERMTSRRDDISSPRTLVEERREISSGKVSPTTPRRGSLASTTSGFLSKAVSFKIGALFNDHDQTDNATSYTNDSTMPDLTDPATIYSLLSQASVDAEGFPILNPERYQEQKKRLVQITNTFSSLQNKLSLEFKVKEATENIIRFNADDKNQIAEAREQLRRSDRKMNEISKARKVEEVKQEMSEAPTLKVRPDQEAKKKLASAEERVRELEAQVKVLKSTVSRLEFEQEPLRELAADSQREARKAREDRDAVKQSVKSTSGSQPSSLEFNRIKLDYATCKAELTDVKEELAALKNSQANLQIQLEQDQQLIQSKDRTIANLLSELEEATNKVEISRAGGRLMDNTPGSNASLSRMLGRKNNGDKKQAENEQMNSMMGAQLKEAVLEREKLKLKLEQEIEKSKDLEMKLRSSRNDDDTDQEDNSFSRSRGVTSPRSRRGRGMDNSDRNLEAKVAELERKLREKGPGLDPIQERQLVDMQRNIEDFLGINRSDFKISNLNDKLGMLIENNQILERKLKNSETELAILEDTVTNLKTKSNREMENTMRSSGKQTEELRRLEMEYKDLSNAYADAQRKLASLAELKALTDQQAAKISKFQTDRDTDFKLHEAQMEDLRTSMKTELQKLKDKYESEISRLKDDHERSIQHFREQISRENDDKAKKQNRELETAKALWQEEANQILEKKMKLLAEQHKSELEEVAALADLEKTRFKSSFQKEQIESKARLEQAEEALVVARQQFFTEKEKIQEQVEVLEKEIALMNQKAKVVAEEWNTKKLDYENIIDNLHDEIDQFQQLIQDGNRKLEIKSRELLEIQGIHEIEVKKIRTDYEAEMSNLKASILELENNEKGLERLLEENNAKLQNSQGDIEQIKAEFEQQKTKLLKDLDRAQDAVGDTTDQLERVQRLLRDVNGDVDRYRKLADSRDEELITVKRQLRQKEKELTEGVMSGSSESSNVRKILDQKDIELDNCKSEIRSLNGEIATLNRKLEVKDREIEEAKSQMRRTAGADQDEQAQELNRMQVMLLELKTTRVDLLEQLDDAQHEAEMLRNELKALKGQ
ncbi:hypothetical protein HK103_006163 [Boothiomyces macroporosus]|uniref:Up-regulated during septation protein 1 domain-containing protein n=1 Tax=Boothiomyces macroporosus TaxID=261099 RepID=A0AAD5UI19_9FUNG|nr:hypothetical protein HK103_006163 [Boothiomyces macroporosus]